MMKRYFIVIALLLLAFSFLWAFMWPLSPDFARNGFGTWTAGTYSRGVEFEARDAIVRASADGELVFACDSSALPGGFPVPEGSMLVMENQGDILSIYTGLAEGTLPSSSPFIHENDILGRTRDIEDGRLQGYLFDLKNSVYLHPHNLFPVIKETQPPQIRSAFLIFEGQEIPLGGAKSVKQGAWYIKIKALDVVTDAYTDGIREARLLVDGSEKQSVTFDSIRVQGGKLYFLADSGWLSGIIAEDGLIVLGPVNLTRGKSVLSLVLMDFAGNSKTFSWTLAVQ